jgi:small subunit ribosomal protein S4e
MARGPKKHLKRVYAPRSWMLNKTGGNWAARPSQGPHKLRESMPLTLILRRRLKYALTARESRIILNDNKMTDANIRIDGKVRRDEKFPAGFMDVLSIEKTGENFRVLYDVKGRFILRAISSDEAKYKLARIKRKSVGPNKVPYIVTHDGRTIRYPNPEIDNFDTVKVEVATGTVTEWVKFETGNLCMITSGNNIGRVGTIIARERHYGGFDIIHVQDERGAQFATRINNVFVIGKGKKPWIQLPKGNGVYLSPVEAKHEHERKTTEKKKKH